MKTNLDFVTNKNDFVSNAYTIGSFSDQFKSKKKIKHLNYLHVNA